MSVNRRLAVARSEKPKRPMFFSVAMRIKNNRWFQLGLLLLILIVLSIALAVFLQHLVAPFHLELNQYASLSYLVVFATSLVAGLTIIAPVPISTAIMIAAATQFNPILIALFASVGGAIGELSGYMAGYLGKKITIHGYSEVYDRVFHWMDRYGFLAIALLAFQPIIPFDVAGMIAGASRMSLRKFLPALWLGKFPKYIVICYTGVAINHLFVQLLHQL